MRKQNVKIANKVVSMKPATVITIIPAGSTANAVFVEPTVDDAFALSPTARNSVVSRMALM